MRVREVYTKIVRSVVAYGAAGFYTLTSREGLARGIAIKLALL